MKDAAYRQALDDLAGVVNVSTGVAHPNDLQKVVEVFRGLLNGGRRVGHTDEIIRYMETKGMTTEHASDVALVYEVLLLDRSVQPGASIKPSYITDLLKLP